jgi:NADPH-dependent ferric siderophore reductase
MSTLQQFKKKASAIFEQRILKTGIVLDVRHWETSNITEIDLHLPSAQMDNWTEVYYMKVKVADFTYRDYTPSGCDAETQTCTLYIDTKHEGPGSKWARTLQKGNQVSYLGISSTRHSTINSTGIVCLGDESSIGHLLALQQLSTPTASFTGAVVMEHDESRKLFTEYFRTPLQPVVKTDTYGHHSLINWLLQQSSALENTIFYLAGNSTMVAQLRKILKQQGYTSGQIKAHGFWS